MSDQAVPQHMQALGRANEIRLARAQVKRDVASGERLAAEVLADPPSCLATMEVGQLLGAQHRWGANRVARFFRPLPIDETKTIGSLTTRHTALIVAGLPCGEPIADMLRARHKAEVLGMKDSCGRLNGSGPCVAGKAGHRGPCVIAVHAPALGMVYFRTAHTNELVASTEVALGSSCPQAAILVEMLREATAR